MHLPVYYVRPKWKKYFNLINSEKMQAELELLRFFHIFSTIVKKKDNNKADAILIASFFFKTYIKKTIN